MATKLKTGFGVNCPHCHDTDATVTIDLNNLAECRCSGCDETFAAYEARDIVAKELARWDAVVRWIEMASELAAAL